MVRASKIEQRRVSFADKETAIVWQQVFVAECPPGGSRMVFIGKKKKYVLSKAKQAQVPVQNNRNKTA